MTLAFMRQACAAYSTSISGLKMSKVLSILGKALSLVQIIVFSLTQGYVLAPSSSLGIFNRGEEMKRVYYHRCGCPPEKVASHTCCCYTGKCCSSPKKPAATCHTGNKEPSLTYLSLSSCGCMEESFGISSGKFDFIGASFTMSPDRQVTLFALTKRVNPEKLLYTPPNPPPEITLPV
jgi:hypothetical protein